MVATVSPAADNYEETLSTLRYADRSVLFLYNEKCYFYFEILNKRNEIMQSFYN